MKKAQTRVVTTIRRGNTILVLDGIFLVSRDIRGAGFSADVNRGDFYLKVKLQNGVEHEIRMPDREELEATFEAVATALGVGIAGGK